MKRHSKKLPPDDPAQSKRFVEAAKEAATTAVNFAHVFKQVVPEKLPVKKKARRR